MEKRRAEGKLAQLRSSVKQAREAAAKHEKVRRTGGLLLRGCAAAGLLGRRAVVLGLWWALHPPHPPHPCPPRPPANPCPPRPLPQEHEWLVRERANLGKGEYDFSRADAAKVQDDYNRCGAAAPAADAADAADAAADAAAGGLPLLQAPSTAAGAGV